MADSRDLVKAQRPRELVTRLSALGSFFTGYVCGDREKWRDNETIKSDYLVFPRTKEESGKPYLKRTATKTIQLQETFHIYIILLSWKVTEQ